ncbi:MAG: dUTP diphosphatase [Alphaproteobacteria bacterium]|jgi:dUTP pyrophosphatase|nr:dUTP diphosphatase [Alphaproteobacteria bacterium]MBT5389265.1 dUTP diphosphatase [Alphaproteobacteria bacterium]
MSSIEIQKLPHGEDLPLPAYATPDSAGLDLQAAVANDITLQPGERALIPCGISIALPKLHEAQVRPRSGLAFKHGITVLNTPGTIDADYRGEIKVLLINLGQKPFIIDRGLRCAQLVIAPVAQATLLEVVDLSDTDRGEGGFGSTG